MAKTRKDSRGYTLKTGESQRKDGRYSYSWTDRLGERKVIYAKTLQELRLKERKIIRDIEDGVDPQAAERLTLNDIYDKYIDQKYDLKATTKANYQYTYDHFVRDSFGKNKLISIKYTDVKKFYYGLIQDDGLSSATLDNVHTVLHPAFQMAVRDGILRVNPSDGVMAEIKKSHLWEKPKRHALTVPQQKAFLGYIQDNHQYHGWEPIITVLLGTGMRIGECLGLRWDDVDFEQRTISVNHNLTERNTGDGMKHINTPKTEAGKRTIPMIDEVFEAFLMEYEIQKCVGYQSETIEGYTNFIFVTQGGSVMKPGSVNRALRIISDDYNEAETEKAKEEGREPVLLPHFSAHHLRHTFCTRLCENESNLKFIQSVMGHADISTTMDIYAEATEEKKQEIIGGLQGKIL